MPFDRLVSAVDNWAGARGRTDVYAQIGETAAVPKHIRWTRFSRPDEFRGLVQSADVVVAHAGMGSILTALELGKPVIVLPRRGAFRETRNDHQIATARELGAQGLVSVAWDERELIALLDTKLNDIEAPERISEHATGALCSALQSFIDRPHPGIVDGVICFGGVDWWYHNRGHYDIQMMRELSRRMPVVYVNSIGMRTPRPAEGGQFSKRVARKLRSWSRGLRVIRENFAVLSPVSVPKFHGSAAAQSLLLDQVRDAAALMGIRRPLVWVACPPAAEVLERLDAAAVVYQRTDRFEHFPGVDPGRIRGYDAYLKETADLTVFCSTRVYEEEKAACRNAAFVDHGVDYEAFAHPGAEPPELRAIGRPRIGFVGGIDAHTFDPELFLHTASAMPECSFVMVGGCSLPEHWCTLENVHFLGRKPYEDVAAYMAACDVLIMPWNRSEWIKACNPVKLKEYLATGRPVVSTPFDELERYRGVVVTASDAESFAAAIRGALENPGDGAARRARVESETWSRKADAAIEALVSSDVAFTESAVRTEALDSSAAPAAALASPKPGRSRYWRRRHFALAGALALVGVWMTSDAWSDLFRLAMRDEESSHIWLVLPIALWLGWFRKDIALGTNRAHLYAGPLLVAAGWALYAAGDANLIQSFWHLGAIVVAVGCAVSVLGGRFLLRLWPAFAVLSFLVPVPALLRQQIAIPLQTATARITAGILETFGTPLSLSGNVLIVNDVAVGIAEACNGIRMVFALTLVCILYAYGSEMSTRTRILVVLASPIIAIGANVARLIPTVWLYGYSDAATADLFHSVSGWAMIPVALCLLAAGGAVGRWVSADRTAESEAKSLAPPLPSRV